MSENLATLVDRSAFLSAEAQLALEAAVGDASWEVDLSDQPTLTWARDDGPLTMRPALLGTVSFASNTWHWGWDNVNDFPPAVVDQAGVVRAEGRDVPELNEAELSLADNDTLPLALTIAAKTLTGVTTHYAASYGPKTDVWFLLQDTNIDLGPAKAANVGRVIAQALATTTVSDHGLAVRSWANQRGYQLTETTDALILRAADGQATVRFSDGKIVDIDLDLTAPGREPAGAVEPATAEQPPVDTDQVSDVRDQAQPSTLEEPPAPPVTAATATGEPIEREQAAPTPTPATGVESEPKAHTQQEAPKKKGFFSRLFGR